MGNGKSCGKCVEWSEYEIDDGICTCQESRFFGKYIDRHSASAKTCKCYVRKKSDHGRED